MYNWKKGIATWIVHRTLYISVPFTWLMPEAERLREAWLEKNRRNKALIGGPGTMQPSECPGFEPLLFHNPCATFTTRGCVNNCKFCAVPKLEPEFIELPTWRPAPLICDNNLLASSFKHIERVIESCKHFDLVDFNQGLEAKRFTPEIADLFGTIRCKIRFAFDHWGEETEVHDAIKLCRERTTTNITVYCLIGFNDTPEDARARLELIHSWKAETAPMRYQPIDGEYSLRKNSYVAPGWTEAELQRMTRYYFRQSAFRHIPYEEFDVRVPIEQGSFNL